MPRPPLPIGTWGSVTLRQTGGAWEARARFRDYDGVTRQVRRTGSSRAGARNALTAALTERAHSVGHDLTADSPVSEAIARWRTGLADRSEGTRRLYAWALDRHLAPAVGRLRLRELTPQAADRVITTISEHHGPGTARTCRTILSQVMGEAVRLDAIDSNPVAATRAPRAAKPDPRALTPAELAALREAVAAHEARGRSKSDVADVVEVQLATGMRIGEVLALRWQDVDLSAGTVTVSGTVAHTAERPRRPFRQDRPKTSSSRRTLRLPGFGLDVLMRRSLTPLDDTLVFPSRAGTVRDPESVERTLRRIRAGIGMEWVTTHTLRRTVATALGTPEAASAQLGNGAGVARRHYIQRPDVAPDATEALEALAPKRGVNVPGAVQ